MFNPFKRESRFCLRTGIILYDAQLNACFGDENSLVCFAKGGGGRAILNHFFIHFEWNSMRTIEEFLYRREVL